MNKKHSFTSGQFLLTVLLTHAILLIFNCDMFKSRSFVPLKIEVKEEKLISDLEQEIPKLMEKAMIPGLSIAVIRDGAILWNRGFGVKNTETGEPVKENTVFEAASLSKPVFAYAVLKLVERGELELDRPLISVVPESYIEKEFLREKIKDDRIRKITARMVLSHTPGFPNWRGRNPLSIQFEPGEKFSYSGEGFVYLQRVVEKLSGKSLNDFMAKEVFAPLRMTHSSYIWKADYDTASAHPHGFMEDVTRKRKPERANGAASLHTTASDFARFIMAIMNRQGLQQETVEKMLIPQSIVEPEKSDSVAWGLGIGLQKTSDGISVWHWGDNGNFKCYVVAFPMQKIGVVYFTNSFYGLTVGENIAKLAIGGEHPAFASRLMSDYGNIDSPGIEFARTLLRKNFDAALVKYRELSEKIPAKEILPEFAMNIIGYHLVRKEKIKEAIEIFKLNVEAFPDSWNVYDSLGEAYMKDGQKELAIENYKKSLELNPENKNGAEMLKKLEENKPE